MHSIFQYNSYLGIYITYVYNKCVDFFFLSIEILYHSNYIVQEFKFNNKPICFWFLFLKKFLRNTF